MDELTRDLETDAASDDPEVRALAADPDLPERAEKHLLAAAEHHDAKVLRILGKRILEVADPAPLPTPTKPAPWNGRRSGPRPRPGSRWLMTATA